MVDEVASVMEPMMRKNRNVLKIDIRVGQLRMTSDETRVRQCLLNLLSNAAKFSRDSTVELQVERAGSDQILFHVIDAGPGLSQQQISRLFQPFEQLHTDHRHGGTGLGLAITRRLCEALNGSISVDSRPGKGSTFSLMFPLVS